MPLDALAGAYAGLICMALATRRPRPALALPPWATAPRLRILGTLLLAVALALLAARLGTAIGIVAWIGVVGVAAIVLVLLLSRSLRWALRAAPLLLALAAARLLIP